MKALYNMLIPKESNYRDYLKTRKKEKMFVRHLVRYVYYQNGMTLKEVAKEESKLSGRVPDHTTIMNSINEIKKML